MWNLAVEQRGHWRPGRAGAPGYLEQCRQLTAARAEHPWLAAGSQTVQETRGSNRRGRAKHAIARLRARETDRRRDWAEKMSARTLPGGST